MLREGHQLVPPLLPSFQTIYQQGRFREHPDPDDKEAMHQSERFVVACLGFVLHHNEQFRAHFLQSICGLKNADTVKDFAVLVEIARWGDLVLISETQSTVFVIECKIKESLKPHQNPDNPAFFLPTGYGSAVLQYKPEIAERTYITLTQEPSIKKYQPSKLPCIPKTWADLHDGLSPDKTSPLVSDLFKTLAEHRIRTFATWNMKTHNKRFAAQYFQACEIAELLKNTAALIEELTDLKARRWVDHTLETLLDSEICRNVDCKNAPPEWLDFTGREAISGQPIAWFGYAWGCVQVGFYCRGDAFTSGLQMLQQIEESGEKTGGDENYVWINKPHDLEIGDQEWIISVFERIKHRIVCCPGTRAEDGR